MDISSNSSHGMGYPRILTHLTDSKTFAEWVGDPSEMDQSGNPEFGTLLNLTGKPIVPDYQLELVAIKQPIFIGPVSNLWRNFDDINDSWVSVSSIDHYGDNQDRFDPGCWNMIIINVSELTLVVWPSQEGVPVDPRPRLVTCYDFTVVEFAPPKSLHLNFLVAKDSMYEA
ncbi:hypothetical protein DAPPUDRAFT_114098 [Daphnia pulex]|uniref:Uncharacterized protein n=1 Tax=Daphnia pulex TaxID=6669 RepID=E9HH09_DAPPU|nr:hypothetical protein DAPPUDRAFT_114098 [Daphnia pulex]|eukprot:EFX68976.1 hypothetical protein DAPPUDRAFT_114098 [Daphnia pulex]